MAYRRNPEFFVPVGTPHDQRATLADFIPAGVTTTHEPLPGGGTTRRSR